MIKTLVALIITLLFFGKTFSQSNTDTIPLKNKKHRNIIKETFWTNDTITKKGKRFRVSNYAIQIGTGGAKFLNDSRTEKYLGNYWSEGTNVYIYYKNFILGGHVLASTAVNISDSLVTADKKLIRNSDLKIENSTWLLGYNIDLGNKFTIDPYIGMTNSAFFYFDNYAFVNGFAAGISINKYFTLRPKRDLGVFVMGNFNKSNYSQWNNSLGNFFYTVALGVEYKFWILKKIKVE